MTSKDSSASIGLDLNKPDVQKLFSDFMVPGVDMRSLISSQQKNIAALTQANQHAVEGMQALAQRQLEIMKQTMVSAADAAKQVSTSGNPKEAAAKQAELAKAAFEQAVTNMREMAEMVSKFSNQAFDVISKRVTEGFDEIKQRAQEPR